jgi:hypothetical protein
MVTETDFASLLEKRLAKLDEVRRAKAYRGEAS